MSHENEADRLSDTFKLGPRELTFCFTATGALLTNCGKCKAPKTVEAAGSSVTGPCGAPKPILLTHGWHEIYASGGDFFVQQLSPKDLCDANPIACGYPLANGEKVRFFVDGDCTDGGLAIVLCQATGGGLCTPPVDPVTPNQGLFSTLCVAQVFVNSVDSLVVLPNNTASLSDRLPAASAPGVCE